MGSMVDKLVEQCLAQSTPPKWEGLPQEDVVVPAGTLKGCYKWTQQSEMMGIKTESTIWTHPKVPLPSMVKSETKNGSTWQLEAYAYEGAKKSF